MDKSTPPPAPSGQSNRLALALFGIGIAAILTLVVQNALNRPGPIQVIALPADTSIRVAVRGAVQAPGVYSLKEGDRVADAIEAAGGYTSDAEQRSINPAARLQDEQDIYVARASETPLVAVTATPAPTALGLAPARAGRLNINTATTDQLVALPGIAELTASRIIAARQQTPFTRIEELRERGIMNERNFSLVQDQITAE